MVEYCPPQGLPPPGSFPGLSQSTGNNLAIHALHFAQATCPALTTVLPVSVPYRDATWILLDTGTWSPSEPRPVPSSAMRKAGRDMVSALHTPLLCLFGSSWPHLTAGILKREPQRNNVRRGPTICRLRRYRQGNLWRKATRHNGASSCNP